MLHSTMEDSDNLLNQKRKEAVNIYDTKDNAARLERATTPANAAVQQSRKS